jgi:sigma-B regulation protein RsbU (phosphoserine phosphatase)
MLAAIERELETAGEVQTRFFPKSFPRLAELDYCGDSVPAGAVGGDLFDFVPVHGAALAASVGHVTGKGIPAAILTAGVQASLRKLSTGQGGMLFEVAEELNRIACDVCPDNEYVTLFYAEIDPSRRLLQYFSAGHECALLVRGRPERARRLESTGTVLGLTRSAAYRQKAIALEPGDVLVAVTDGITEAQDPRGRAFGEVGVLQVLQQHPHAKASELVAEILDAVEGFTGEQTTGGDRTVLVARLAGPANFHPWGKHAADLALAAA